MRLNPRLSKFQSAIAEAFVQIWIEWSTLPQQQATAVVEHHESLLVPVELKYATMAYLSPADIMKFHLTK